MIEYFPFPILELEYVDIICYTLTEVSYHAKQNQRKSQRERERERAREKERESSMIKILQHVPEPSTAVEMVGMESL